MAARRCDLRRLMGAKAGSANVDKYSVLALDGRGG